MSERQVTAILGGWEGYRITAVCRRPARGSRGPLCLWLTLEPQPGAVRRCSGCGELTTQIHEVRERVVRDLPVFECQTWLRVGRVRVCCPHCGPKLEMLSWLGRYERVTRRLAESVGRLCKVMTIKHVAEYYGLGWDTVKAIDKAYLEDHLGPIDLSGVEVIGMDEIAIQKGHRYATVVVETPRKRVLWVGRGRGRADVRPFFELLGEEGCQRLKAVVIDTMASYRLEVEAHCPGAQIVYDLYHMVARYGKEVIDRVRVDQANQLRHDKKARRIIKGSRWLLLRNPRNVTRPEDQVRLRELLAANRSLMTVYVLKEDLKQLWRYRYPGAARRFFHQWYRRAIYSRIEPLKRFARLLKQHLDGILAHCRWPLHTSLLEGINNRIKVIKRMAYGFRDDNYFFLKIRAAFPGIPG